MILSRDIATDDALCAHIAGERARTVLDEQMNLGKAFCALFRESKRAPPWMADLARELADEFAGLCEAWGAFPAFRAALQGRSGGAAS